MDRVVALSHTGCVSSLVNVIRRFGALAATLCLTVGVSVLLPGAAAAADITMGADPTTAVADGASSVTVTARAPVMDAGIIRQEIVQQFDPAQFTVVAASGIQIPFGWTLSYSADGTNFGPAPTTSAGWAAVRAVKASGPIDSQGSFEGRQIATATAVATTPLAGSFASPAGAGDGYDVFFDSSDHVFNRFHHAGWGAATMDCHKRDGTSCGPGWPFNYRMSSPHESTGWVDDSTQKVWFNTASGTHAGFGCVDVSNLAVGPRLCGGSLATAWFPLSPGTGDINDTTEMEVAGTRIFAWNHAANRLMCFDVAANSGAGAQCPGSPLAVPGITTADSSSSLKVSEGRLYTSGSSAGQYRAVCLVPSTLEPCEGWETPKALGGVVNTIYEMPSALGDIQGVCFEDRGPAAAVPYCFSSTGRSVPANQALANTIDDTLTAGWFAGDPVTAGSRVYSADGHYVSGVIRCFDVALNANCPGWPKNVANYALVLDPANPNCIWKNTDSGLIAAYDATGALGCTSPPPWADIDANAVVPRMACTEEGAVRQWRRISLIEPSDTTFRKAYLTVYRADGTVVTSGGVRWSVVEFPVDGVLNLSGLAVADSGPDPTFRISFTGRTTNDDIKVAVEAVGDAPELCVPLVAEKVCPIGPAQAPNPLFAPFSAPVTGRGSAELTDGTDVLFNQRSVGITLTPPADPSCLGTISGTTTVAVANTPSVGVIVTLRDAQGNAIATTTTDASGNYSFARLAAGGGYHVDFGEADGFVPTTATTTGETTSRTVTAGAVTDVDGQFVTRIATPDRSTSVDQGDPAVFNPFATVGASAGATPSGTEAAPGSFTATEKAATRLCDPSTTPPEGTGTPPAPCTLTSRTVDGQGTWAVNTTSTSADAGKITFTPLPTFAGTATTVTYQVTDTVSGTPVSDTGTLDVIVTPGGVTDDRYVTKAGTAVNASVATNDATGVAYRYSAATQPANGTLTMNADGTFRYTPNAGFSGQDTFTYSAVYPVCDAQGNNCVDSAPVTATVTIDVAGPPDLEPDTSTGAWDTNQVINPLTNDLPNLAEGVTLSAASVRICTNGTAVASCTGTSLTVANQGTYTVNTTTGEITFNPLPGFTGAATPIQYVAADSYGQKSVETITPTVQPPAPSVATADTSIGPAGRTQTANLAGNDTAPAGATITASTVKLCNPSTTPPQEAPNCTATDVTVADEGRYVLNTTTGVVTFTPLAGFEGEATPLAYQVTDSLNRVVSSAYTPTVIPPPTVTADTSVGAWDSTQQIKPFDNDTAAPPYTLVRDSVRICTTATAVAQCTSTSLTVAGQGTYVVNTSTGVVTFDPLPTFVGTATPIRYVIEDSAGSVASTTITPTVLGPPADVTAPDLSFGKQGQAQVVNPLANDSSPAGVTFTASSVKLCGGLDVAPDCNQTSVTVDGQGTYTVNGTTGAITFTPLPAFTGTATEVRYSVVDSVGREVSDTYTPTVVAPPTTAPDTSSGSWKVPQVIDPLANDAAARSTSLDPTSVRICTTATATASCTGTSLTISGQGTYVVDAATGAITFTPDPGFTGSATPIKYVVADAYGQKSTSTVTPEVAPPPAPQATPESKVVAPGGTVAFTTVTGSGGLATTSGPAFATASTCLITPGSSPQSCDADGVVSIAGEGTYTLVRATGIVTFQADSGATAGTKTSITYKVVDATGQAATSTLTPVIPAPPAAANDTSVGQQGATQVISLLSNDAPGSTAAPLRPSTVRLCDISAGTPELAPGCTATTVTVQGEGVYTVNSDGTITFVPDAGFTGPARAIPYTVEDALGREVAATLTVEVKPGPVPTAVVDTGSAAFGQPVVFDTIDNDGPGTPPDGVTATLNPASVRLCDPSPSPGQAAPNCTAESLTVDGEGTYTVNTTTGDITFAPATGFTGTATRAPAYQVCNTITGGTSASECATSAVVPTIDPPAAPVAVDDSSAGAWDTPQLITVLGNDTADRAAPLVASTVRLCSPLSSPAQAAPNCTATSVTVPGQGTYSVGADGTVTFDPLPGFRGAATPVGYQVEDATGAVASARITPSVTPPPAPSAAGETKRLLPGTSVLFTRITGANGLASGEGLRTSGPGATCLVTPGSNPAACDSDGVVTVAGQGTWSLNPATGEVAFSAMTGVAPGTLTPMTYRVTDVTGQVATATLTPIIPAPPAARNDESTGAWNVPQAIDVVANDVSATGVSLVATSVRMCGDGESVPYCTATRIEVPNQGTYTLDTSTGRVTFTPLQSFSGNANAVRYQVTDTMGQVARALIRPTVLPVARPVANPDTSRGRWKERQVLPVRDNDAPDLGVSLKPGSTFLCAPLQVAPNCTETRLEVPGEGVYEVGDDEQVVFTPDPEFAGTATPVAYQVSDILDQAAMSRISVVVDPDPPVAESAEVTLPYGTPGTLRPVFVPGTWAVDASKTCLAAPDGASASAVTPRCQMGEVRLERPEGVYELDPATGVVTFTPTDGFVGTPANPPYIVFTDLGGQQAEARLTPTVLPKPVPPAPTAQVALEVAAPPVAAPMLRITTRASRPVLRVGQTSTITLRVSNRGGATARDTVTRAAIPRGFAVAEKRGGTVRAGFIYFRTGSIGSSQSVTRSFVLVATARAAGARRVVLGRSRGSNVPAVRDPAVMRVVAAAPNAAVTG